MKELGNFIRDFTLIDFMGILFPGSILLLLLQMDYSLWDKLDRAWGAAPESGVRVAFILIGGYFVGTLLMELGDFWEQFIWKNPLLNPRSWAAISTGLYNQVPQTVSKPKWQIIVNLISGCLLTAVVFLILFFSGVFGLLMRHISSWICIAISLVVFFAAIYLVLDGIFRRRFEKYNQEKLLYIQQNDSIFMGFLPRPQSKTETQKTEQPQIREVLKSKQTLFDGFRIMSRNMLLVFILICAYGRYSGKMLHDYYQKLTTNIAGCSILFIILLLLSLRYWRFSYLKYKYYYEVFVSYGQSNSVVQGASDTNNSSIQNENTVDNNTLHNVGSMS